MNPLIEQFDWDSRDYRPIIESRIKRLNALRDKTVIEVLEDGTEITRGQQLVEAHKRFYAQNHYVEFITDWLVTHDPRLIDKPGRSAYIPFIPFPAQVNALHWMNARWQNKEDGAFEKSREVGASWMMFSFALWMWLFKPGAQIGFGSYKEAKIDKKGDPNSLFEKGRLALRHLPEELLPRGYKEEQHAPFLRFINPENGASITGESGDQVGRGGRASIYFIDEAAFFDHPENLEASLSETTDVRIWASSAHGTNHFYNKVVNLKHRNPELVFRLHWKDDPRKNDEWYASRCKVLEPHVVAQEIDIDYTASVERVVIPQRWVEAAIEINRMVDWPLFRNGVAGLDLGGGGEGQTVYVARFGPFVDPPRSWRGGNPTADAHDSLMYARDDGVNRLNYDAVGVGTGAAAKFEDEKSWLHKEIPGKTVLDAPSRIYAHIEVNPVNGGDTPSDAIWPDDRRSSEKFANLRAELWWIMRERFLKTYEYVLHLRGEKGGVEHPLDELIVMPNDPVLQSELSMPTWDPTSSGKILIESKKSMKSRGVSSPDRADALALTFLPEELSGGFGVSEIEGLL